MSSDSSSEMEWPRSDPVELLTVIRVLLDKRFSGADVVTDGLDRGTHDIQSKSAKELSHQGPFCSEAGPVEITLR